MQLISDIFNRLAPITLIRFTIYGTHIELQRLTYRYVCQYTGIAGHRNNNTFADIMLSSHIQHLPTLGFTRLVPSQPGLDSGTSHFCGI